MKKLLLSLMALFLTSILASAAKPKIDRIDPPYWWTGMKQDTLQLMVYGPGIAACDVTTDYPGVTLAEQVKLESPDYLLLYLKISSQAQPGVMKLTFADGKKKTVVDYTLKARDRRGEEYTGFDSSDVLYLIMPDRFSRGSSKTDAELSRGLNYPTVTDRADHNARHGGDIEGMRRHLDYIDSLGVTAVWVNPVLTNDIPGGSYHGYATTDYYSIDPRFGSNDEWNAFVAEAQSKDIKVVMDMIFNHCGIGHPWLKNLPSSDWINNKGEFMPTNHRLSTVYDPYASDYDYEHCVDGWFVPGMPDLNQRNPHVSKYLIQNSIWWIESSKINGIRMDTHPYADMNAMADWINTVKREYPNFNIVGECWYENEGSEAFWQAGSYVNRKGDPALPTVMDFVIATRGREAFNNETKGRDGMHKMYDHLGLDYLFPNPKNILTFLDNHDTDRFLLKEPENLDSWKQAVTFLLTTRGIPQIYYGTELLMNGTRADGGDGNIRRDFPGGWEGDTINAFTAEGRTPMQNEAWAFMSRLLNWRRDNTVISDGSLKHFIPDNGIYVYERRKGDKQVVVIMNGTNSPVTTPMAQYVEIMPYGTTLRDMLTGKDVTITEEMTFPAREILILEK